MTTSGHCHNRFRLTWLYGDKAKDDCIEVKIVMHQNNKEGERNQDQDSGRQAPPPYDPLCERRGCGGTTFPQDQDKKDAIIIEIIETKTKTVQLKRWSTFRCHNFPDGAIVVGFRGRRDYKDGVCQGIMCYAWSNEQNHFIPCTHTISNGYNSKISVTDFETLKLCDKEEFTLKNPDAVKSIKIQLR